MLMRKSPDVQLFSSVVPYGCSAVCHCTTKMDALIVCIEMSAQQKGETATKQKTVNM